MGYIPADAKWYIAELIEEIRVEGDPRNSVQKNLILVRADSPEQAYDRALELGKQSESEYKNSAGKLVRAKFRGLGGLNVIHDELIHGAEILYEEVIGVSEDQINKWIAPKQELAVFAPVCREDKPDYKARDILEEANALIRSSLQSSRKEEGTK